MNPTRKTVCTFAVSLLLAATLVAQTRPPKAPVRPVPPVEALPPVERAPLLPPLDLMLPPVEFDLLVPPLEPLLPFEFVVLPLEPLMALPELPLLPKMPLLPELPELAMLPPMLDDLPFHLLDAQVALESLQVLQPDWQQETSHRLRELEARARAREEAIRDRAYELDEKARDRALETQDRAQERDQRAREREEEARERAQEAREREQERRERIEELYSEGYEAIGEARWERAIQHFDRLIDAKGSRADGASYWKAYAQYKLGDGQAALATLQQLLKSYPQSRYLRDAKNLEASIRQAPTSPNTAADEDLIEMALRGLVNAPDDTAIPTLEKFLQGSHSPRLKKRALFVLAQRGTPRSREALAKLARGELNPDLQSDAVRYLGLHGGREARTVLAEIYAASSEADVKRRILQAFMTSGDKERLLAAAKGEQDPELRAAAIRYLGSMGAGEELWQMYQSESSTEVKKRILNSLFVGGKSDRLMEVARNEQDAELRRTAIRGLGNMGKHNAEALAGLYTTEKDPSVRKEILRGLFVGGNDTALIAIARKESDPALKKQIVQYLANMNTKAAQAYMLEILNQ